MARTLPGLFWILPDLSMNIESLPYLLPYLAALLLLAGLFAQSVTRRDISRRDISRRYFFRQATPGVMPFLGLLAAAMLWVFSHIMAILSTGDTARLFWFNVRQIPITLIPLIWLYLALDFTGRLTPAIRQRMVLAWVVPLTTLALIWTSAYHGILRVDAQVVAQVPFDQVAVQHGPWYVVSVIYSVLLMVEGYRLLYLYQRGRPRQVRRQTWVLLGAIQLPALAMALELSGINPLSPLSLAAMALIPTALLVSWALQTYRLFGPGPILERRLVYLVQDGVLVTDLSGQIVEANQSAGRLLAGEGEPELDLSGQPALLALSSWPEWLAALQAGGEKRLEILVGAKPAAGSAAGLARCLEVQLIPLDEQGEIRGCLSILRDITSQRRLEQAQSEREVRFRLILEAMPIPVLLVRQADAAVLYANRMASQVFGVQTALELFSDPADWTALLDRMPPLHQPLPNPGPLDEQPTTPLPGVVSQERRLRRPGGELFWAQISIGRAGYRGDPVLVVGVMDISEQRRAQDAIQRLYQDEQQRADALAALNRIGQAVLSSLNLDHVLRNLLDTCLEVLPIDAFYVATYDEETFLVDHPVFYDRGEFHQHAPRDIRRDPGLSGWVIQHRQTLHLPDTLDETAMQDFQVIRSGGVPTRTYVGTPLIAHDRVVGAASMQSYRPGAFNPDQIRLFETIAAQAALAVENSRLYAQSQHEVTQRTLAEEAVRAANEALGERLEEIEGLQQRLADLAIRDPLTGLYNRRYLEHTLDQELARAARLKYPLALVMLDIDHFKRLNDSYGHMAGDEVLKALAQMLRDGLRVGDVACRYGGEEFLLLLPGMPENAVFERAEQLREAFASQETPFREQILQITLSGGIAMYPRDGKSAEALLEYADRMLYLAKRTGRNQVRSTAQLVEA